MPITIHKPIDSQKKFNLTIYNEISSYKSLKVNLILHTHKSIIYKRHFTTLHENAVDFVTDKSAPRVYGGFCDTFDWTAG